MIPGQSSSFSFSSPFQRADSTPGSISSSSRCRDRGPSTGVPLVALRTGGSPENALVVWSNSSVADDVDSAQRALLVTACVVLAITLWRRWIAASPPLRRTLIPAVVGSAAILLSLVLLALDKFDVEFETARWVVLGAYLTIPLVVLAGILRSRLARSTVGDLLVELRADPSPPDLSEPSRAPFRSSLDDRILAAAVRQLGRSRGPPGASFPAPTTAGRRR